MTRILVTNDDGVNAPGILALARAMRQLGEVAVVAPAVNQSASGHKKTLFQDIPIAHTQLADGTPAVAVSGSPADCIALMALGINLEGFWPPRVVVSGINRGANLGQDVTYSGTVSAALEATIHGISGVAVSLDQRDADHVDDYETAAQIAVKVVRMALTKSMPPFTIINLNVPAGKNVKGLRVVRQGIRIYNDELDLSADGTICRIVGPAPTGILDDEGTDLWAIANDYASVTPIDLDLTAHRYMATVGNWDIEF